MTIAYLLNIRVLIPILIFCLALALLLQLDVIRSIVDVSYNDSNSNLLYSSKDHCKIDIGELAGSRGGGGGVYPAIIAASLRNDPLGTIGGTEHWFHLMERVIPIAIKSKKTIAEARTNRSLRNDTIFLVVFQEKESAENISEFSMLILTAALIGN